MAEEPLQYEDPPIPSHLQPPMSPLGDTSSGEAMSDNNDPSDVERNDTGSGNNNNSDEPRPKGLGDAWKDIPMSQAIEFIPVLTTSDLKDIARYKSKVVVARINEQISTQKERMSQSIANQREKMSQSLSQQKEKMSQQKEKMSQSLSQQKEKMSQQREKMSQSLSQQKEKMSQQKEKMSQSISQQKEKMSQQREKMSQSLSQQKEKMSQQKEKMSQSISQQKEKMSQQREKMSQSFTQQKERVSQSLSNQKERINLRSKQMREQMSVQAARVHQMSEQVMIQMKTKLGAGLSPRDFEMDLNIPPNLRDVQTSPEHTPESRKKRHLSLSCPNLSHNPLPLLGGHQDNLSICSYATSVSARSSHSDLSDALSLDSESPFSDEELKPDTPLHHFTPAFAATLTPTRSISHIPTPSPSCDEVCPPLPKWVRPRPSLPLLTYPQLPEWYKDNECIRKYYRPPLKTFKKCLKSIGYWHNETGNIWSHLLGIVLFLGFLVHFAYTMFSRAITDKDFSWEDPTVISMFLISALTCLFLSTFFHTFLCHSKELCVLCLRLDYCGIAFLILGSEVPWVYYLFYCLRTLQLVYISICVCLGVTAITTMIAPLFNRPKFRIFRALLFGCVGSFGLIPALHAIGVQGFAPAMSLGGIGLMFCGGMFYIVGAGIYAIRFPEKVFPGKCDLLLQSHTIFHICVLIAATFHYFSLLRIQEIRLLRGEFCNANISI